MTIETETFAITQPDFAKAEKESLHNKGRIFIMEWLQAGEFSYWSIIDYFSVGATKFAIHVWADFVDSNAHNVRFLAMVHNGNVLAWNRPLPLMTSTN